MDTKKWVVSLLTAGCLILLSNPVMATIGEKPYVDDQQSGFEVSGFLNKSKVEYEDTHIDFEPERMLLGVTVSKNINEKFNVYGTLNYLIDGSLEVNEVDADKDSGFILSSGTKYKMMQSGNFSAHVFGQLDYILQEEYNDSDKSGSLKIENSGFGLTLGAAAKYQINANFAAYGALSVIPFEKIDCDYKGKNRHTGASESESYDLDRDNILGFRFGGSYDFVGTPWFARAEIGFGNEQAFLISGGVRF